LQRAFIMSIKNKRSDTNDLDSSICEAALDRLSVDTIATVLWQKPIRVTDFVLLSFVCDQGCMDLDRLADTLGMSRRSAHCCVERLDANGLIHHNKTKDDLEVVCGTPEGIHFVEKANTANNWLDSS